MIASGMLISNPTAAPIAQGGSGILTSGIRKPIAKRLAKARSIAVFLSGNSIGIIRATSSAPNSKPATRPNRSGFIGESPPYTRGEEGTGGWGRSPVDGGKTANRALSADFRSRSPYSTCSPTCVISILKRTGAVVADGSAIEWTDATWNPITGCTKITAGCDNCYAARFAERFRGVSGHPFERGFDLTLRPERLAQPLSWRRPRMIFVNSMSDLFHKEVPQPFIDQVFDTMEATDHHIYQVLTKRSSIMRRYLRDRY